jgi:hypothetical protein
MAGECTMRVSLMDVTTISWLRLNAYRLPDISAYTARENQSLLQRRALEA